MKRYENWEHFCAERPERRQSTHVLYGAWWRDELGRPWKAFLITRTNEVVAVSRGRDPETTEIPGGTGRWEAGDGAVMLLAEQDTTQSAVSLLGWRDVCGTPDSLAWLLDRLSRPVSK